MENATPLAPVLQQTPPQPLPSNTRQPTALIALAVLVIVIVGLSIGLFSLFGSRFASLSPTNLPNSSSTTSAFAIKKTIPTPTPEYVLDTDLDFIPDKLEQQLSLNPVISEFSRCAVVPCASSEATKAAEVKNNILFILDSSGSMGLQYGGKTKMELAKVALASFMKTVQPNVTVGIMVYGHKGSNSATDMGISCASADIVAPLGSVSTSTLDGYLSQINPVGWTPIGLAIKNGMSAFAGKEGQKNQMIIITDGAETCATNPSTAAAEAKASVYQIKVDVIGFAVNTADETSLKAISTGGGGLFSLAMNSDDIVSQANASHENWLNFQDTAKCSVAAYNTSYLCLEKVRKDASTFLMSSLVGKKGAQYYQLSTLQSALSSAYFKKIGEVQDEGSKVNRQLQQKLLNQ